jgi:hypothetical protein
VELGRPRVERNAHLRAESYELVNRSALCRAHVRGRDDADASFARNEISNGVAHVNDTAPEDERTDQINGIRTSELGAQLASDVWLAVSVYEEVAYAERRRWRRDLDRFNAKTFRTFPEPRPQLRRAQHLLVLWQQLVHKVHLRIRVGPAARRKLLLEDLRQMTR